MLVLGNKIDKPGAASEDELRNYFNLFGQTTGKVNAQSIYAMNITKHSCFIGKIIFKFLIFNLLG